MEAFHDEVGFKVNEQKIRVASEQFKDERHPGPTVPWAPYRPDTHHAVIGCA
jgi:hypothetical protein